MNKMNKKGFTIVELVIVIAVIAILAGVLIPTFGGIIERANESAEMQAVTAAYKEAYALALSNDGKIDTTDEKDFPHTSTKDSNKKCIRQGDYEFSYDGTTWSAVKVKVTSAAGATPVTYAIDDSYSFTFADGAWTANAK